jgi:peptide deformylase
MGVEACLSIPGYYGEVERNDEVVITGQDRHGKDFRIKAKGWLARVFQHEIDHLDGVLFIDLTKDIWRAKDEDIADAEDDAPQPSEATESASEK